MPTSTNVTNLKINELTEAQYDSAVQQGVIGANEISIITDAEVATGNTVTLDSADWVNSAQTVTVNGMTASTIVLVAPKPADASAFAAAGIMCTGQATDSLTFTAVTTPSADIDVNVVTF